MVQPTSKSQAMGIHERICLHTIAIDNAMLFMNECTTCFQYSYTGNRIVEEYMTVLSQLSGNLFDYEKSRYRNAEWDYLFNLANFQTRNTKQDHSLNLINFRMRNEEQHSFELLI